MTDQAMRQPSHGGHLLVAALRRHRDKPVMELGGTTLTEKVLVHIGADWYASDNQPASYLPEEVVVTAPLVEGATKQVTVIL